MSPLAYELTDRSFGGYRGRWRYRVVERDVANLDGRKTCAVLFRRRSDAAQWASQCEVYGRPAAARWMSACGMLGGEDFKVEFVA